MFKSGQLPLPKARQLATMIVIFLDSHDNAFTQLDTNLSIFETGIKVVDLLAPHRRAGKIRLFARA